MKYAPKNFYVLEVENDIKNDFKEIVYWANKIPCRVYFLTGVVEPGSCIFLYYLNDISIFGCRL